MEITVKLEGDTVIIQDADEVYIYKLEEVITQKSDTSLAIKEIIVDGDTNPE
jgi:hypothetical protein